MKAFYRAYFSMIYISMKCVKFEMTIKCSFFFRFILAKISCHMPSKLWIKLRNLSLTSTVQPLNMSESMMEQFTDVYLRYSAPMR